MWTLTRVVAVPSSKRCVNTTVLNTVVVFLCGKQAPDGSYTCKGFLGEIGLPSL